jgi:diguanylate cyclase (GGDEF)-like protein
MLTFAASPEETMAAIAAISPARVTMAALDSHTLAAPHTAAEPNGPAVQDRARLLAAIPLFHTLMPLQLRPLADASELVTFQPGEAIVRQGEPGESVFVIVDGRVEVLARAIEDGRVSETVISWLVDGDALGELSLLDGEPRSATCLAVSRTHCLRLGRDAFLHALERHWPLSQAMLHVLARRMRTTDALLADHARDPLTGLNNRRALADLYHRETLRAQRVARKEGHAALQPLAVLFADVDDFKAINDQFSHQTGDDILRAVADVLTKACRTTDFVARYGGDEFVMILPDAGQHGADLVARRVRQVLRQRSLGPIPFSVSIGVTLIDPNEPPSLDEALAAADRAMYADKARLSKVR